MRPIPFPAAALAGALLLAGCGRPVRRGSDFPVGRVKGGTPSAAEWLARREAEASSGSAALAEPPAWTEPAKLPPMKVQQLPVPEEKIPEKPEQIVAFLSDRKADRRILGLIGAWRKRPPEALPALGRIARGENAFSVTAVRVLARYAEPDGSRALLACLGSRSAPARAAAAGALCGRRVEPRGPAEAALVRAARGDRDWRVRAAAARALGRSTAGRFGPEAELALERLMGDAGSPEPVRLESAAALARAGVDSGWNFLEEAGLAESDPARAALALRLAGECGGRRGAALLAAALQSQRTDLWTAAIDSFALVNRAEALVALASRLKAGGETGRRAALALAPHVGRTVLPEVVEASEKGSATVRAAACIALAVIAGADAAAALERKLLDVGEVPGVRAAAARALGRSGGPVVAPALQGAAKEDPDETVRLAAREALALIEARLKAGSAGVSDAAAERFAFTRWELKGFLPGRPPAGCRLADEAGFERAYRVGDEVALGYRLSRLLGAGEEARSAEVIMAGRAATRTDLLRVVLVKGDRAVVLVRQAVEAEK